jgi:hypothetical protein
MVAVPNETPVSTPDTEPMVATAVLLLLHLPPETELPNVEEPPIQTDVSPVIAVGRGVTVTKVETIYSPQQFEIAYTMATLPPLTPVTTP